VWAAASGQCPQPGFTIPDTVCTNETFSIPNTTTGADRYEWDFCSGDLAGTPTVTEVATVAGAAVPTNITPVFDGTNYYAFVFGRDNGSLFRLNFGNSPDNPPTVTNLGYTGTGVNRVEPLDFVQEGGNWYALAANALGNSNLLRLNFGANLSNRPSVTDLGNFGGKLSKPRGLKVVKDKGNYTAIVTNAGDNTVALINFGPSITAAPAPASCIKTSPFATAALELISTSLIQDCGRWYGLTISNTTSQVYRLDFGDALFNVPAVAQLWVNIPVSASLFSNQLVYDGAFTALLSGLNGGLFHLNFGESMAAEAPEVTNMGVLTPLADVAGFTCSKYGSRWITYAVSYAGNKVHRLDFPDPCGTALALSDQANPAGVAYTRGGKPKVTLTAYDQNGSKSISKPVFVRADPAPDFTAEGSPARFNVIAAPGDRYVAWQWNFDDGTTASEAAPTHIFGADKTYDIALTVTDVCGATRTVSRKISVAGNTVLSCPLPGFTLPDTVCANAPFDLTNTTLGAERYAWDFCSGDLRGTPVAQEVMTITAARVPTNIATVSDGTQWYGFFFSRENNTLFRLDFGTSLNNAPSLVSLGNLGAPLNRPEPLAFVQDQGQWYAFTSNFSDPARASNSNLIRLNFGPSLTNRPSLTNLSNVGDKLLVVRGITIVKDGRNYVGVLTNAGNNTLTLVNFGNSVTNPISAANVIATPAFPGTNNRLINTSVIKNCDKWYGIVSSDVNGAIYKLSFGSQLFSLPAISPLNIGTVRFPALSVLLNDDGGTYGFVSSELGNIFRLDFGNNWDETPRVTDLGYLGILSNTYGFTLTKEGSSYIGFGLGYMTNRLARIRFPNPCTASVQTSAQAAPAGLSYSGSGWQKIAMTAYNPDGNASVLTDSVFVRAPLVGTFSTDGQCVGGTTRFTAAPPGRGNRITAWHWDFGDGTTGSGATVTHTYTVATTYDVTLTTTDLCGRISPTKQQVRVYRNTAPGLAAPDTFCSGEPQTFADASSVLDDTSVGWYWDFGNASTAEGAQVTYAYPDAGQYTVTLTVKGISGCSVSITKSVTVKPGVTVRFTESALCIGSQTQFLDQSVVSTGGAITSRRWSFGDGTFSNAVNPVHEYNTTGTYKVTLTITSASGCINFYTKEVVIRRLPQVAFGASLACSGEAVSFADESNPVSGVIAGWRWDFGDPESGANNTATGRQAEHTYGQAGTYRVKLVVFTSHGCADSLTRTITVAQSPRADFAHRVDCGTKTVAFTSQSTVSAGETLTEWYWEFGDGAVATTDNPTHTYRQAGAYPVTLVVTGSSRCRNVIRKTVQVADAPVADFTFPAIVCAGQPVTLQDASTVSAADPVVQWQWQLGGQTASERSPVVTLAAGPAEVTLSITTASGCQATVTRQIAVRAAPVASFSYQPAAGQPLGVAFKATAEGATTLRWDFGDGQTADQAEPVHAYTARGTYKVILTAGNGAGCTQVVAQEVTVSESAGAYALQLERVTVQSTGSGQRLQVRLLNKGTQTLRSLSFQVAVDGGAPAAQPWSGTLPAGGVLNYAFTPPQTTGATPGELFCVQAIDEPHGTASNRACASAANAFTLLNPAPNPARHQFRLAFILPEAGGVRLQIVDALGRTVAAEEAETCPGGYNEKPQSVVSLAKGLYFIRLTYREQVRVKPLLVE
jgi:PKD repeat protein